MTDPKPSWWQRYRRLPTLQRELATFALTLLFSLTVLPLAIFIAGRIFLGEYIRDPSGAPTGGFFSLWGDYVAGIATLSPGYWVAFLGPYFVLLTVRALLATRRPRATPAAARR